MLKRISAFAIFLLATMFAITSFAKGKPEYYEIRVYSFKTAVQKTVVEDYFKNAAIPAYNRAGVTSVGVFDEADQKDGLKLYVLIPYKSLDDVVKVSAKLSADAVYQQAGKPYLDADHTTPAYERFESSLSVAFKNWTSMKVPTTNAPKSERVYEYRLYESHSEVKGNKKVHMFNEGGEIDIFVRLGFNPVFYAQTIIGGKQPNLVYMTTFDNRKSRDEHWKAFGADSEWNRIKVLPEYDHAMTKAEIHFLTPTEYSQI
ncbi:NIPSNAP protein [Arcicella aurantiaca]|uniref:NIPSNAP protein n=1 Tax=Arcicella aurantiaca TaxID=591202 RepID=A0A316DGM7_9BACT|nr:NIPSNAP family protein [Arcicella aurantiaca]PWK17457.1 NIPSNAP protein [Arcicella aurantiaca]